jgi:hypothetical protein
MSTPPSKGEIQNIKRRDGSPDDTIAFVTCSNRLTYSSEPIRNQNIFLIDTMSNNLSGLLNTAEGTFLFS